MTTTCGTFYTHLVMNALFVSLCRAATKRNASTESENVGTSRMWKGESNYFTEKDEEETEPHHSQPTVSPNTYANFETSSNGRQQARTNNTRTQRKHSMSNGRIKEQSDDDNPVTTTRHPVSNTGETDRVDGRDDATAKESNVDDDTNSCDSFEVVSQLSGGHDQSDYERQGELFLSRIAHNASFRASDTQVSTQQRHLVDSPAMIQRYLAQNEGTSGAQDADQAEATASSSVDRLQVHQEDNDRSQVEAGRTHERSNTHRHSRRHRARSGSVTSGEQDRRPLRELEPAPVVAPQLSSNGHDDGSSQANVMSFEHTDETAKATLHRWASNDDLSGNISVDARSSNAEDTAPVQTSPTWDDQAQVTRSSLESQNDSVSEQADESPIVQLPARDIDVERVIPKSRLPPLSHVPQHPPDTTEHGSRKTKRHDRKPEHHQRSDDEAASGGSRRKKHRHHKHRGDGDEMKSERTRGDEAMSTGHGEHADDVTRSVSEDGDDNKKERRRHREKHHSRRPDDTADESHAKHDGRHVERSSESAMKDLVISYKKSHREKTLKQSEGVDV